MTSPPAPEGWNQPDFVPDSSWQPGLEVWWEDWTSPTWCPLAGGCDSTTGILLDTCHAIGILDKFGNPEACDGTTPVPGHLHHSNAYVSPDRNPPWDSVSSPHHLEFHQGILLSRLFASCISEETSLGKHINKEHLFLRDKPSA